MVSSPSYSEETSVPDKEGDTWLEMVFLEVQVLMRHSEAWLSVYHRQASLPRQATRSLMLP